MHGSCVSLVWHQHEVFPFMHASVLQAVAGLRWWDHAQDFEY
jgi:hypothetical protein